MPQEVPFQGRSTESWRTPLPSDSSQVAPDVYDVPLLVQLAVFRSDKPHSTRRDDRWAICWSVGYMENTRPGSEPIPLYRQIHLSKSAWPSTFSRKSGLLHPDNVMHYPGALTKCLKDGRPQCRPCALYPIIGMNWQARRLLEDLAFQVPVMTGDENWNEQDFIASILQQAVSTAIVTQYEVDLALASARGITYRPCGDFSGY